MWLTAGAIESVLVFRQIWSQQGQQQGQEGNWLLVDHGRPFRVGPWEKWKKQIII